MRTISAILLTLSLIGCSPKVIYHGYSFKDFVNLEAKIEEFEKKQASIDEVILVLGSPTFSETFKVKDKTIRDLFYLEERFLQKPLIGSKLQKIKLLRLTFNHKHKLEKSQLLEVEKPYLYDKSQGDSFNSYQLKFFEQIKKNFEK